ncbi:MAG: hypothetical protein BJ554DRAFT_2486 [Olpidium bornovanus]|uniref:Uncharacterized protein n=1 Tax=Olpidium bornovanus TaxID=278681 RepID=A0A8H8A0Y1_9FUNG|nr:MAG: hypothetical protein BJ554DRAFT_2486 [Olpidium bornovanus]
MLVTTAQGLPSQMLATSAQQLPWYLRNAAAIKLATVAATQASVPASFEPKLGAAASSITATVAPETLGASSKKKKTNTRRRRVPRRPTSPVPREPPPAGRAQGDGHKRNTAFSVCRERCNAAVNVSLGKLARLRPFPHRAVGDKDGINAHIG